MALSLYKMSALTMKADFHRRLSNVRFVPKADIRPKRKTALQPSLQIRSSSYRLSLLLSLPAKQTQHAEAYGKSGSEKNANAGAKPPQGAPLDSPLLPPKLRDFLCGMH